ncbi:hypothetical protein KDA23_01095, partial [Candidatus Saccharibacteria bacterium]|nr:hypothetical protein [Candidatus Saccharibacteria bacterium]
GYGGTAASTVPGPNSPVKIKAGDSLYTSTGTIQCASLLDSGVVDVRDPSPKKFGTVTGNGKFIIRPIASSFTFPVGTFTSFFNNGGTVQYSDSTGLVESYTLPTSPSTYGNLILSSFTGNGVRQLPDGGITINNDLTIRGSTGVNFSDQASGNIVVSGNLILSSSGDSLRFLNGTARAITVTGHVLVASGAVFHVQNAGTAVTNTLSIGKGLTNNGVFDMAASATRICDVTFTGTADDSITGTGSTTDFNRLIVNKGTSQTPTLRVNATNFTISGATDVSSRALTLTNGTFRLSSAQTVTLASGTSGLGYTIPATAQLWIDGGTAQITSTVNENLVLRGKVRVSAGAFNVGTVTDGSVVNTLVYDA